MEKQPKQVDPKHLRYLFSSGIDYLRDFGTFAGHRAVLAVILMLVGALIDGVSLASTIPLLQLLLADGGQSAWSIRLDQVFDSLGLQTQAARISAFVAGFFLLIVLRGLLQIWRQVLTFNLNFEFCDQARKNLFRKLLDAPWHTISQSNYAELRNTILREVARLGVGTQQVLGATVAAITISVQLLIAFLIAPQITIAVIVLIGLSYVALQSFFRRALHIGRSLGVRGERLMRSFEGALSGLKAVKAANHEDEYYNRVGHEIDSVRGLLGAFNRQRLIAGFYYRVGGMGVGCLVLLSGLFIMDTPMPILVALVLILSRLVQPAMGLQQGLQEFANMLPAYQQIKTIEASFERSHDQLVVNANGNGETSFDLTDASAPTIRMQNITFRYGEATNSEPLLDGLDLSLEPNTMTALVGPSGSGKTTAADLLIGLLEPAEGTIFVGDTLLDNENRKSWRDHTAYLTQEPYLIAGTIAENLSWTTGVTDEKRQWDALAAASADEMVRSLPKQLQTDVGEGGQMLSGGQRQGVCLARAFLRNPKFIVLDEASSAIDPAWERRILDAIGAWRRNGTVLMITHRYDNLDRFDRIITIKNGQAVELSSQQLGLTTNPVPSTYASKA